MIGFLPKQKSAVSKGGGGETKNINCQIAQLINNNTWNHSIVYISK